MTDFKKENTKPLIDTEDPEEDTSLVSFETELVTSTETTTATLDASAKWDEQPKKKEHSLATAIVVEDYDSDPWAQPDNDLLTHEEEDEDENDDDEEDLIVKQPPAIAAQLPSVATTTVFDAIDNHHDPIKRQEEDQDTSAVKVNPSRLNFF